jgi:hypothetical protein
MTPQDFSDPVMYGMTQGALAQNMLQGDYARAAEMMAWYSGDIPTFTRIDDYNDFAIVIFNAYQEAHPPQE